MIRSPFFWAKLIGDSVLCVKPKATFPPEIGGIVEVTGWLKMRACPPVLWRAGVGKGGKIGKEFSVIEEIAAEDFGYAEDKMTVRNGFQDFFAKPPAKFDYPFPVT